MKKLIIAIVIIVLVGLGVYFFMRTSSVDIGGKDNQNATSTQTGISTSTATQNKEQTVLGTSVEGRPIMAYHYGTGSTELLFVGGIHGGYEWNTVLVAGELMNYLKTNPSAIPTNVKVTVVPILNPDGLNKVVSTSTVNFTAANVPAAAQTVVGRFNGNNVDLNRNFDCDWQTKATWQNKEVSGGTAAFSEPESQAIKNYVESHTLAGVVVWYSAAGGVFSSSCHNGVLDQTRILTNLYAKASGYPAHEEFNFYEITGDMVNWLAKKGIPAISVLLTTHESVEWSKNKAGIDALLKSYALTN